MNHTLKSYRVSTIDEFRVCFEFNNGSKSHVDGWIDFAISKGVTRLEFDFTVVELYKHTRCCYTFPNERFMLKKKLCRC